MPTPIDWDFLAVSNGFLDPAKMIRTWYLEQDISINNIALRLGLSHRSVSNFMLKEGIEVRKDKERQKKAWQKSMAFYARKEK